MVGNVRKTLRRRMAKAGIHELVDNADVTHENQHRCPQPRQARDEDVRLTPSCGSSPQQDGHKGEGTEGRGWRCSDAQPRVPKRHNDFRTAASGPSASQPEPQALATSDE